MILLILTHSFTFMFNLEYWFKIIIVVPFMPKLIKNKRHKTNKRYNVG